MLFLRCGNILRIDSRGKIFRSSFDDSNLWHSFCFFPYKTAGYEEDEYIDDLKSVAMAYGYSPNMIDRLIECGYLPEEIEEFLYEDEGMIYG